MKIIEQTLFKQITLTLHGSATTVIVGNTLHGIAAINEDNNSFVHDLNFELNWSLYMQLKPALVDMDDEERAKIISMIGIDEEDIARQEQEMELLDDEDYIPNFPFKDSRIH